MTASAGVLRELHRIHQQLSDLRDRLERGPKQILARQANVSAIQQALADAKAAVTVARMETDEKQLQLKIREAKVEDLKTKLNTASTNREYQALVEQIAADEMAGSVLADEILEAFEDIDGLQETTGVAKNQLESAQQELVKAEEAVRRQESLIRGDITRLEGELQGPETALPVDAREAYQRAVKSLGSDAMAEVEGEICGGCHHQITANKISQLMMGHVVNCNSCNRFLYLPEDRAPGRG